MRDQRKTYNAVSNLNSSSKQWIFVIMCFFCVAIFVYIFAHDLFLDFVLFNQTQSHTQCA